MLGVAFSTCSQNASFTPLRNHNVTFAKQVPVLEKILTMQLDVEVSLSFRAVEKRNAYMCKVDIEKVHELY